MTKETDRQGSSVSSNNDQTMRSPYELTKTGLSGEQRETMLHSELQIMSELGKPHCRGHKLPPLDFTYGISMPRRDGGVSEALNYPPEVERQKDPDYELVRDYVALNKASLEAGLISAKGHSRFRTLHDIKRKVFIREVSMGKKPIKFPEGMVFGKPCRPSTPIGEVMQYRFQEQWLEDMKNRQLEIQKERLETDKVFRGSYHTKASLLRQAKIPVDEKPLWKMSKFADAEHQVDSFRSEELRRRAFSVNVLDSIPRQGTNHTGIYDVPRTTVKV